MRKELDEKTKSENRCVSAFFAFISSAAILNIIESLVKLFLRYRINDKMLLNTYQSYLGRGNIILLFLIFIACVIVVRKADYYAAHIKPMLLIWGVILIGVRGIYEITSIIYTNTIKQIFEVTTQEQYVYIYNSTHGFKYLGMMVAMILGTIMTGIMLKNKRLIFYSVLIMLYFIAAFTVLHMYTLKLDFIGKTYGIVWTSVIYHLSETVGLLLLSFHVRMRYYVKMK